MAVLRQTPFGYQINLSFLPQQNYRLDLYNRSGQHIWGESQNGLSIHPIDTFGLSTGIYFLSYTADGMEQATKYLFLLIDEACIKGGSTTLIFQEVGKRSCFHTNEEGISISLRLPTDTHAPTVQISVERE